MEQKFISVRGAREHNLKNVDLDIPRDQFVVITGLSGSGKSSLAFDTIYAEGQRRYVESLSAYARQFLDMMGKPDVDHISGLSPAISIEQKTTSKNPRSTVGTVTEIHDYLRVLYARVGQGHCPTCRKPITAQTREQVVQRILAMPAGTRFLVLAPVVRGQKGEYKDLFADIASPVTDWLFMLGLLGIGLAVMLGIGLRLAAVAGTLMMVLMWVAEWPLLEGSTNPVMDYHIVYALVLIISAVTLAGDTWGLGRRWAALPLVQQNPWLR